MDWGWTESLPLLVILFMPFSWPLPCAAPFSRCCITQKNSHVEWNLWAFFDINETGTVLLFLFNLSAAISRQAVMWCLICYWLDSLLAVQLLQVWYIWVLRLKVFTERPWSIQIRLWLQWGWTWHRKCLWRLLWQLLWEPQGPVPEQSTGQLWPAGSELGQRRAK